MQIGVPSWTVSKWKAKYLLGRNKLIRDGIKYKKNTILEACKLLKQGEQTKIISRKLNVEPAAINKQQLISEFSEK